MNFDIRIKEEGGRIPLSSEELKVIASRCFKITGKKEGDISLVVCDDGFISSLNEKYLSEKSPTDVLAFPQREGIKQPFDDRILGDIVISVETAEKQASQMGKTLVEEFKILFVHGLLHLLGYDHDTEDNKKQMDILAEKILSGVMDSQ